MEWLGLLLLYLISGYVKKRQQNQKRRQIEEDPEWDSETVTPPQESSQNLDQLLNDLFDQATNLDPESPTTPIQAEDSEFDQLETPTEEIDDFVEEIINPDEINKQPKAFEEKIYHSKLADRKELHFGKKWLEKTNLRKELFNSKKALQKSIIIKEVLDKPLALRQ